jgi:hypothetical protein
MVERHHIDVVVTAREGLSKEEIELFFDEVLIQLEHDPDIFRAYVEGDKLSEDEKDVLLEALFSVSGEELALASESVRALEE